MLPVSGQVGLFTNISSIFGIYFPLGAGSAGSPLDERGPYRERVHRASCSTGAGRESSGFGGPGTFFSLSWEEDLTFGRAEGRGGGHPADK